MNFKLPLLVYPPIVICPDITNIKNSEIHITTRATKESDIKRKIFLFDNLDIEVIVKLTQRSIILKLLDQLFKFSNSLVLKDSSSFTKNVYVFQIYILSFL